MNDDHDHFERVAQWTLVISIAALSFLWWSLT